MQPGDFSTIMIMEHRFFYNRRIHKKYFLYGFVVIVFVMSVARWAHRTFWDVAPAPAEQASAGQAPDSILQQRQRMDSLLARPRSTLQLVDARGRRIRNRIYSVPDFGKTFPDLNDLQLVTAMRLGVPPVPDRAAAERNKEHLVCIDDNPFYHVQPLYQSIPYLVPPAAHLLEYVARNFIDSLASKGLPFHKIIVTSVLRTEADVAKLRNFNANASSQSCHRYGTTFDISYNRYITVEDPDGPTRRKVRNDSLKWILSEVLRDLREMGACYVKYEVKQGCYHVTVR